MRYLMIFCLILFTSIISNAQSDVKTTVNEREIVVMLDQDEADKDRGYLGAIVKNGDMGVEIQSFNEYSPARIAGVQVGDLITQINKNRVVVMDGLIEVLRQFHPGDEIDLTILRKGKKQKIKVTLGKID